MKITKYNSELQGKAPILVKEGVLECSETMIDSSVKVACFARKILNMHKRTEEYMYMFPCNTQTEIIGVFELSHGTVNSTVITPREVFMKALLVGAASIILVHNHPSQNVTPSSEDIKVTKRIKLAGGLIGIELLDHVIIGNGYYSMRDEKNVLG